MIFRNSLICLLALGASSGTAFAQSCPETVGGRSMAQMIGEHGGAEKLHQAALAFIAEADRWLVEIEPSRNQGIREDEIEALVKKMETDRELNRQLAEAARCYMGG